MKLRARYENRSNERFWAALDEDRLVLQRCDACAYVRHPESWLCPNCLSDSFAWQPMSGHGRVETFVWYFDYLHTASGHDFDVYPELPYNVTAVRLDEGPLLISNTVGVAFGELAVGAQVEATYDHATVDDLTVLRFRVVVAT